MKNALLKEVNRAIFAHLVTQLSVNDQIALDSLLNTNPSDQQLNIFFVQRIPNLQVEIASALLNFRTAYLYPVHQQIANAVESISPAVVPVEPSSQQVMSADTTPSVSQNDTFQNFPLPPSSSGPSCSRRSYGYEKMELMK